MNRIEVNVSTGEKKIIDLTPAEVADAQARTAAENAENVAKQVIDTITVVKAALAELDSKSIRGIREFLVAKFKSDPLMPKDAQGVSILPALETEATKERAKLK